MSASNTLVFAISDKYMTYIPTISCPGNLLTRTDKTVLVMHKNPQLASKSLQELNCPTGTIRR